MQSCELYKSEKRLHVIQHIDSFLMSAAEKRSTEKCIRDFDSFLIGKHSGAKAQNVCIVVLAGKNGGFRIHAKCRTDPAMPVCRHAHTDAGAAD